MMTESTAEDAAAMSRRISDEYDFLDGLLFSDAQYATAFLRDAERHRSKRIVAYDYFPWAGDLELPLTTIDQPIEALAQEALKLVRRRLEEPDADARQVVLTHTLVARASSTRPGAGSCDGEKKEQQR